MYVILLLNVMSYRYIISCLETNYVIHERYKTILRHFYYHINSISMSRDKTNLARLRKTAFSSCRYNILIFYVNLLFCLKWFIDRNKWRSIDASSIFQYGSYYWHIYTGELHLLYIQEQGTLCLILRIRGQFSGNWPLWWYFHINNFVSETADIDKMFRGMWFWFGFEHWSIIVW